MIAKVFFAAIAQPNSKDLRNLFFFRFGEPIVELERPFALHSTGAVSMPVPMGAGEPDPPTGFFSQGRAGEVFVRDFFLFTHGKV